MKHAEKHIKSNRRKKREKKANSLNKFRSQMEGNCLHATERTLAYLQQLMLQAFSFLHEIKEQHVEGDNSHVLCA